VKHVWVFAVEDVGIGRVVCRGLSWCIYAESLVGQLLVRIILAARPAGSEIF
jgi:hypothetical protein